MTKYLIKAIDEQGNRISDEVEADTVDIAANILSTRGYIPVDITAEGGHLARPSWQGLRERLTPVTAPDLIVFTKQFKTMLRSGVPIMELLYVLKNQTENISLKAILDSMATDIKEGASLYEVFSKHPSAFSPLYCSMVRAGEASGALQDVLERLTYIIEHEHKIRSDIKSALQYPMIVILMLIGAFFILLTFVIPKFIIIFQSAGLALPIPTLICMKLYQFLNNYLLQMVAVVSALTMGTFFYLKTAQGKYLRDSLIMKVPIVGPLMIKAAMARFASIFSILQSSGVDIMDSMKILSSTIGNAAISKEFNWINEQLEEGRGIAAPLRSAKHFTPIVVNMVAIGEESSSLDEMLKEVADHYDFEIEYAMKKLTDSIGPVLTVCMAVVVGFFALAIFLPMWDLVGIVK